MSPHDALETIELRTLDVLCSERETLAIGPFLAGFDRLNDLVFLNYAVPTSAFDAFAVAPSVWSDLRREFRERARTARFEFLESRHPRLALVLESAGFQLQLRVPLMICRPCDLRIPPATDRQAGPGSAVEVRLLNGAASDEELRRFQIVGADSFGNPVGAVSQDQVDQFRENLRGNRHHAAFGFVDGQPAGIGSLVVANDELAGVGTLPRFRRRGVATRVSAALVARHFAEGGEFVWLSAGNDAARATYEKIGFVDAGVHLSYIDAAVGAAADALRGGDPAQPLPDHCPLG